MKTYRVKELFLTLQGEGAHTGRAAVFCRFTGCNLWSGREEDRERARCRFCDTDFVGTDGEGGGVYAATELAERIAAEWGEREGEPYTVLTGGEPLLQVDPSLIDALHAHGLTIGVETNGTVPVPQGLDWVCVSPKPRSVLRQTSGDELKLVYPQPELPPERFDAMDFAHRWVQPMDGPDVATNTRAALAWCLAHPRWRLSLQTHKLVGFP